MPIKKDGTGKRWVEMEIIVPGTPEEVWRAMATGPGTTAWFTPTTIDERVGGAIRFDLGPNGESVGEVTAWEPPFRFGYVERDWSENAPPVATEITVTARAGSQCLVRMVHSLFASTDDWDDQLEGFEQGWPGFFEVLRLYLAHFAGQPAAISFAMASAGGGQLTVWKRLLERLGLTAADVGETRTVPQPEPLSGVIERVEQDDRQRYVLLRLTAPVAGVALIGTYAMGDTTNASMSLYFYGQDAARHAEASAPRWQNWLGQTVGQP